MTQINADGRHEGRGLKLKMTRGGGLVLRFSAAGISLTLSKHEFAGPIGL